MFPPFRPHPLIRGGHAQTILGCYLPGIQWTQPGERHLVPLPDGDRLVLHDALPAEERRQEQTYPPAASAPSRPLPPVPWRPGDRVALLVHGLGGCHQSGYMQRTAAKLVAKGVRVFRMDLRGCGAGFNLAKWPVHAGRSEDIGAALAHVMETCPGSPVFLVGYSMGGNLVLKLAGELGRQVPANLAGVLAVSPPIDLVHCSGHMERGISKLYNRSFLRSLLRAAAQRRQHVPPEFDPPLSPLPKGLKDFDDRFTAPLGGFASADEYYMKVSAGPLLKEIAVPTVVVAAADDPIIPVRQFEVATYSSSTRLAILSTGGHLGFVGVKGADPDRRWLDWRTVEWVTTSPLPKLPECPPESRSPAHSPPQMAESR